MASRNTKLVAKWTRLVQGYASELTRSSHCLAVAGNMAYVFGGELRSRVPIDNEMHILSLTESRLLPPIPSLLQARVGAAMTASNDVIYLWGGRGGKDMSPLSNGSTIHTFDVARSEWDTLLLHQDEKESEQPEDRSYHSLTLLNNTLYLHAGCPTKGRLAMLHSLSLDTPRWKALASAPGPARGGTALVPYPPHHLIRFGGFSGYELGEGGVIDVYDTRSDKWASYDLSKNGMVPAARSVHALVPFNLPITPAVTRMQEMETEAETVVALLLFGELDPAPVELGHDGAGKFSDEVWALIRPSSTSSSAVDLVPFERFHWVRVEAASGGQWPEARGWFAAGTISASNEVVVVGGLNGSNERLGDAWTLQIVPTAAS